MTGRRAQPIPINSAALAVAKGLKFLTPLIIMPFLLHTVGVSNLGVFASAEAIISYFLVVSDYGFSLTAAKQAAELRNDPSALSRLFSAIVAIKAAVAVAGLAFVGVGIAILPSSPVLTSCVLLLYLGVVGNIFHSPWLFQGLEDTRPLAVTQIFISVATIAGTILMVRHTGSVSYAALAFGASTAAGGLLSFAFGLRLFGLHLVRPTWEDIVTQLRRGWLVFLSMLSVNTYTTLNVLVLTILGGTSLVGQYKVVNTVVNAFTEALAPIGAALYAPLTRAHLRSLNEYAESFYGYLIRIAPFYAVACVSLAAFGPDMLRLLGQTDAEQELAIRLMAVFPAIQLVCVFGTINLMVRGLERRYLRISLAGMAVSAITSVPLVSLLGLIGAVLSYLLSAIAIAALNWRTAPHAQLDH